jgi:hypothetical protein
MLDCSIDAAEMAASLPELVLAYQSKNYLRSLNELTLWFIGQQPGMRLN